MEQRFRGFVSGEEPLPPALSAQPLFRNDEIVLFEDFLDNLATENEFLFHRKVPASLSWDGFVTTKNRAFDDVKHSGLHFGSDAHFSPTNGYIATHKFVPAGYGHVHPQSTAQRSRNSSASSRVVSRRPSIYDSPSLVNNTPQALGQRQEPTPLLPSPRTHVSYPVSRPDVERGLTLSSYAVGDASKDAEITYSYNDPGVVEENFLNSSPQSALYRETASAQYTDSSPGAGLHSANQNDLVHMHDEAAQVPAVKARREIRRRSSGLESPDTASKKMKTEDGAGKQNLTAGKVFLSTPTLHADCSAQKRQNHISSEQRRRNLIKEGFIELTDALPDLTGNPSKSTILHEAISLIKANSIHNQKLKVAIDAIRNGRGPF